jgi:hypothetical protein
MRSRERDELFAQALSLSRLTVAQSPAASRYSPQFAAPHLEYFFLKYAVLL